MSFFKSPPNGKSNKDPTSRPLEILPYEFRFDVIELPGLVLDKTLGMGYPPKEDLERCDKLVDSNTGIGIIVMPFKSK